MSDDYEFEDDDAPVQKKAAAKPAFDPFAGESVDIAAKAAPEPVASKAPVKASPSTKPKAAAGAPAKAEGDFDPFAGGLGNDDMVDENIKPGQGRDLWTCPHCGAKNKPGRDVCRACNKHKDDEVIVPALSKTSVKVGIAAGAVLVFIILFLVITGKDLSLRAAHADSVVSELVHDGSSRLAGVGRILRVTDNADVRDIVIVFGYEINGKEFSDLKGPNKNNEISRGSFAVQPHVRLKVSGKDSLPKMERGDYISFSGTCDTSGESFETSLVEHEFAVAAGSMQFAIASAE